MNTLKFFKQVSMQELAKKCEIDQDYASLFFLTENLYKSPPDYLKWQIHAKMCFSVSASISLAESYKTGDLIGVKAAEIIREVYRHNGPARYVSKEMCEAFKQTPIPPLTKDILEVLPYMQIMLPRYSLFDHLGEEILSLVVRTGELYPRLTKEEEAEARKISREYFSGAIETPRDLMGSRGVEIATITAQGCNVWQDFVDENAKSWHDENVKYQEKSGYDCKETATAMQVAINCLLVHLYEPELVTTEKFYPSRKKGFAGSETKGQLGITWIGNGFKYQVEGKNNKENNGDTKASVRAHWRRGHWHSYLVNKGRSERIVKWIKPIYVRGNQTV